MTFCCKHSFFKKKIFVQNWRINCRDHPPNKQNLPVSGSLHSEHMLPAAGGVIIPQPPGHMTSQLVLSTSAWLATVYKSAHRPQRQNEASCVIPFRCVHLPGRLGNSAHSSQRTRHRFVACVLRVQCRASNGKCRKVPTGPRQQRLGDSYASS